MISRQIPAQVMTVADKIIGNLSWTQVGWLGLPIGLVVINWLFLPPVGQASTLKAILALVVLPLGLLAVRFEHRLISQWLGVWFGYYKRRHCPATLSGYKINDQVLDLGDGHYKLVLQTEGLNLDLLTKQEQLQIFGLYENFLNSLDVSWQSLVRIRRLNPDQYLSTWQKYYALDTWASHQAAYQDFVRQLVDKHHIVVRYFYLVLSCQLAKPDIKTAYDQLLAQAQVAKQGLSRLNLNFKVLGEPDLNLLLKDLPTGFKRETPDYLVSQQGFERCLEIATYPLMAKSGWLSDLSRSKQDIDIAYYYRPVTTASAVGQLNRKITQLQSQQREALLKERLVGPEVSQPLDSALKLREELTSGQQSLVELAICLRLRSKTLTGLNDLTKQLQASLAGQLISLRSSKYEQSPSLLLTSLLGTKPTFWRNFDSASAALTLPFWGQSAAAIKGVLYGVDELTNSLVLIDRFSLPNANSLIFAQSGSGKSYAAKLEIARSLIQGIKVAVLDPEGEYQPLAEHFEGQVVYLGQVGARLNLLQALSWGSPTQALDQVVALFELLLGKLSFEQRSALEKTLVRLNPRASLKDLYASLEKLDPGLAAQLEKFVKGPFQGVFGSSNLDCQAPLTVFDFSQLSDQLRPVAMVFVSLYLQYQLKSKQKRLLVIDEAWLLMDNQGGPIIANLVRRARKHGLGVTLISQQATDFLSSTSGQAIVAQSCLRFFLGQDTTTIRGLARSFVLSDYEQRFLLSARPGQALLLVGTNRFLVRLLASDHEHRLLSTSLLEGLDHESS